MVSDANAAAAEASVFPAASLPCSRLLKVVLRLLAGLLPGLTSLVFLPAPACRRCLCEWLQSDAISRGLAAAATAGARAAVQAAVAAERHEVGDVHNWTISTAQQQEHGEAHCLQP